jgi:Tfp pilus assembly protein PilN
MFSDEFSQKKIFLLSGKAALIFFLITLSVNYVVFNNYYNKRNELSAKVSDRLSTIKLYDTLKVQLEKKKEFIGKTSLLAEARTSFYADKLAAEVPSEILLDDLNINPVMKKPESDTTGSLNFTHNVIVISGTSKNSVDVGEWMKLIKMNGWVKDAELLSYNQDKERNEGKFNIKVNIK